MKKNFLLLIFIWIANTTLAQNTKVYPAFYEIFICKNPNGVVETLLATYEIRSGKKGFIYRSSSKPNVDIPLTVVSNQDDEIFIVTFPNDQKLYTLKTCIACPYITSNNPDGSVQTFELDYRVWGNRGTYRCINADKSMEYLRIEGAAQNLKVKYSSSKNPKWIDLRVSNVKAGDMDIINFFDVQFPNDKRNYRIVAKEIGFGYECWLPNGGSQSFDWINK
jgi:hypothetical protein